MLKSQRLLVPCRADYLHRPKEMFTASYIKDGKIWYMPCDICDDGNGSDTCTECVLSVNRVLFGPHDKAVGSSDFVIEKT